MHSSCSVTSESVQTKQYAGSSVHQHIYLTAHCLLKTALPLGVQPFSSFLDLLRSLSVSPGLQPLSDALSQLFTSNATAYAYRYGLLVSTCTEPIKTGGDYACAPTHAMPSAYATSYKFTENEKPQKASLQCTQRTERKPQRRIH